MLWDSEGLSGPAGLQQAHPRDCLSSEAPMTVLVFSLLSSCMEPLELGEAMGLEQGTWLKVTLPIPRPVTLSAHACPWMASRLSSASVAWDGTG